MNISLAIQHVHMIFVQKKSSPPPPAQSALPQRCQEATLAASSTANSDSAGRGRGGLRPAFGEPVRVDPRLSRKEVRRTPHSARASRESLLTSLQIFFPRARQSTIPLSGGCPYTPVPQRALSGSSPSHAARADRPTRRATVRQRSGPGSASCSPDDADPAHGPRRPQKLRACSGLSPVGPLTAPPRPAAAGAFSARRPGRPGRPTVAGAARAVRLLGP